MGLAGTKFADQEKLKMSPFTTCTNTLMLKGQQPPLY